MGKTEVYSWRVAAETKRALEEEARRQGLSLAAMLDHIATAFLEQRRATSPDDEEEQKRLHAEAAKAIGVMEGPGDLSTTASQRMRAGLKRRYDR